MQVSFRRMAVLVAIAATSVLAVSVGSSAAASSRQTLAPLSINIGSYDVAYVPLFYGVSKGYFKDAGVDLNVVVAGASQLASVLSGQTDIIASALAQPYNAISQGQKLVFLGMTYSGGVTGFVAGKSSYSSVKDCKTMATFIKGGGTYAWSQAYKDQFQANDMQLQATTGAYGDIAALLASGRADCATATYGVLSPQVASGQFKWIIDPRQGLPGPLAGLPDSGYAVLRSTLQSKRSTLIAFLKAFIKAKNEVKAMPAGAVAQYMHDNVDGYKTQTVDRLTDGFAALKWFFSPNNGYLEKWRYYRNLNFLINSGLDFIPAPKALDKKGVKWGYDVKSPYSYQSTVDMSLLRAALKK